MRSSAVEAIWFKQSNMKWKVITLTCVLVICEATNIKDFSNQQHEDTVNYFEKDSEIRSTRSVEDSIECTKQTITANSGENHVIKCCCKSDDDVKVSWMVDDETRISEMKGEINLQNITSSTNVTCLVHASNCTSTVIIDIETNSTNNGVVAFLVILFICFILVFTLCYSRRNKNEIFIFFRDTFHKNSGTDGMVYDAFVSIAKGETNKQVDVLLRDVLSKKCGYNLLLDNTNILPQLDYNANIQGNIHKCRRLLVVFSANYLTNDWCMYCMGEGLRKIVELNIPTIFIITDFTILRELRAFRDIISRIPQVLLCSEETQRERKRSIALIRRYMPSVPQSYKKSKGMRQPMLSDVEDTHKSSTNNVSQSNGRETYQANGKEVEYTFPDDNYNNGDDDAFVEAMEAGDEVNPDAVQVHQYNARKDLYKLTLDDDVDL